jgi:hypothetical protein
MQKSRPATVRTIFMLSIVNGIILLVGGAVIAYFIPTIISSELDKISNLTDANQLNPETNSTLTSAITNVAYAFAFVSVVLGLAWFGVAWYLFTIKRWTWLSTVILAIITIIFSILSIGTIVNISTLIISGVILYLTYRPEVKSYFGRATIPK